MGLVFLFTQPLYLLTTAFSPFTFKVIIGRYVLIVIFVTVFRWVKSKALKKIFPREKKFLSALYMV